MAPATPRQRQYNAALIAQQHNLQGDLLTPLYTMTLPAGQEAWPGPVIRPRARQDYAAVDQQNTLFNLAANVPPDGRETWPDSIRAYPRIRQDYLSLNLQGTTFTPPVENPPDGRQFHAYQPRPVKRQDYFAPNLLNTGLAEVQPPGAKVFDLPVIRKRTALQPDNYQYPLLPTTDIPQGDSMFVMPAPAKPRQMPDYLQDQNPLQTAALVIPQGESWYLLPTPARRRIRVQFEYGFTSEIRGVAAQSNWAGPRYVDLLGDRLGIDLIDRHGVDLLGDRLEMLDGRRSIDLLSDGSMGVDRL